MRSGSINSSGIGSRLGCRPVVRRVWLAAALSLFVVSGLRADKVKQLDVTLDPCPALPEHVHLVMDDEDGRVYRIELEPVAGCHWIKRFTGGFSTSLSHFSLRLGIARTECHKAIAEQDTGHVHFNCCSREAVRSVTIKPTPSKIPVSYLREVSTTWPGLRRPDWQAVPCLENGILLAGEAIDHVQFGSEKIHLQIGLPDPNRQIIGLRVNDLRRASGGEYEPLMFDDVVYRLIVQRADTGSLSPNAIELDVVKLREIKLEKLEIQVK
jgi:hypothetical protein